MNTVDILKKAKAKIEDPAHWCQGMFALDEHGDPVGTSDPRACRWCAQGAMSFVAGDSDKKPIAKAAQVAMAAAAVEMGFGDGKMSDEDGGLQIYPPVFLNDTADHPTVMKMFDRAIQLAQAEGE